MTLGAEEPTGAVGTPLQGLPSPVPLTRTRPHPPKPQVPKPSPVGGGVGLKLCVSRRTPHAFRAHRPPWPPSLSASHRGAGSVGTRLHGRQMALEVPGLKHQLLLHLAAPALLPPRPLVLHSPLLSGAPVTRVPSLPDPRPPTPEALLFLPGTPSGCIQSVTVSPAVSNCAKCTH